MYANNSTNVIIFNNLIWKKKKYYFRNVYNIEYVNYTFFFLHSRRKTFRYMCWNNSCNVLTVKILALISIIKDIIWQSSKIANENYRGTIALRRVHNNLIIRLTSAYKYFINVIYKIILINLSKKNNPKLIRWIERFSNENFYDFIKYFVTLYREFC